ncbi:hypothetical protein CRENBAI_014730 [Crenichthys baileyi]|uniref:Uncharacterized protein n=1 Tax=Crenichthys baileyi TaxID=28760 RepID=A0AAV9RDF7_9TELE
MQPAPPPPPTQPQPGHPKVPRKKGVYRERPVFRGQLFSGRNDPPSHSPGSLEDISPSPSSSPSSSSPSGFLSDLALDDVLFADIDTSMYDFDPCTTAGAVGAAAGGGNGSLTKLSPVMNADDLLKTMASPYSGSTPQVSANQPFKIDLTELDHIMEVLVGS